MKKTDILKQHIKTIIILALCLCIPFILIWYAASYVNENIFHEQKGESLYAFARVLDSQLTDGGYDEILINAGMENASRDEKIAVLNEALRNITDDVAHSSSGLGVGYYSRELDAIITYGPSEDYQNTVGVSIGDEHPGRRVMATGIPEVVMGSMVRGNIMNAMIPVVRGGAVIGYIWSNNLVSELEHTLQQMSAIILLLLVLSYIIIMTIIVVFIRRMIRTEQRYRLALSEALDEAKIATRAKSTFLSNMSHEIRTPMNAIIGMTSIAESTDDVSRKNYAIEKIKEASNHLLGVINDILDMSKIEAEKFDLSPVSFNFEKMLQKVADVINFRVEERRQKFYVNIGKDIPNTLFGDDQRLSQVITNLLSNAVKFTPEEGTIRLNAQLDTDDNGMTPDKGFYRIKISVEDTGIGITNEQQQRLFRSFEQAEADTTRKFGGTGLGLAISKRIVDLMNGDIWVESEQGKGTKFTFTVLLQRGTGDKERLLDENVNWSNIRIFVVDDEPEILEYFTALSNIWGIKCTTADNGEKAAEIIMRDDNYDIFFIDWRLPDMYGSNIARIIREKVEQKPIVVLLSSISWAEVEYEAREAGIDKFLPKPLFPSTIVDLINECIGAGGIAEQSIQDIAGDDFTGHRILLAEDVEINREIVMTLLEPTNLTVECAENGKQTVDMFIAVPDKYDMIFMDVQMPEMDGYDATRAIRSSGVPGAGDIPIIAMTANVFREDIERCLEVGMNNHVGKPLDINEVLGILREYLRKAR